MVDVTKEMKGVTRNLTSANVGNFRTLSLRLFCKMWRSWWLRFQQTGSFFILNIVIHSIYQVQNLSIWNQYCHRKDSIEGVILSKW